MVPVIDRFDALERLRQPEYTGENRCLPCTVANVAIAFAIAVGIAVASPLAGVLAFGCCLAIIAIRGYLIPGTPTLTQRYLPERVLRAFGKASDERPTVETADLEDALEALVAADVVARGASSRSSTEAIRLTPQFRRRWDDRLERFGPGESAKSAGQRGTDPTAERTPDATAVAEFVNLEPDAVRQRGETTFELEGSRRRRWESAAALAADIAADRELRNRLEGWADLEVDDRQDVLTGLRLLRERCPAPPCDGRLTATRDRLEHCCRRTQIGLEVTCEDCGRPIVTVAAPEDDPLLEWVATSEREHRDAADAADAADAD
ncbi:hypothetical protein [Halopiger aswanensis]|uniref:Uncharacterized protein n=1 Tax=Halopiger aswanensis TaxID=148449 RepID=A0A3R7FVB2_9EURY|nr:hypothetical protein [Halopiger aswanensis]RKD94845.1 hypothetical protein ATJ93_1688 [Halopiger aswanensis]